MAAEAQAEVQALLTFLTREAKVPLAVALPKYNVLRKQGLTTPDAIAKGDANALKAIFEDEKVVKQILTAAKRLSNPKKRAASSSSLAPSKHLKGVTDHEAQLKLPVTDATVEELGDRTIETNRAPLFLAFAYCLTKYTLSDQPLSSRLSLAQAVTSAGAQSKAKYIGLTDTTAEDEGWAQGQPKVRLMGREIAVMRRHIQIPEGDAMPVKQEYENSQKTIEANSASTSHEAFWGIDLEALKKSNGPLVAGRLGGSVGPPIHRPEGARSYLLKSIDFVEDKSESEHKDDAKTDKPPSPAKPKKLSAAEKTARKEQAVAGLLKVIDHVYASWASTLSDVELDRRASSWYAKVRPDVAGGQAGWGQRGKVPLQAIFALAKEPERS